MNNKWLLSNTCTHTRDYSSQPKWDRVGHFCSALKHWTSKPIDIKAEREFKLRRSSVYRMGTGHLYQFITTTLCGINFFVAFLVTCRPLTTNESLTEWLWHTVSSWPEAMHSIHFLWSKLIGKLMACDYINGVKIVRHRMALLLNRRRMASSHHDNAFTNLPKSTAMPLTMSVMMMMMMMLTKSIWLSRTHSNLRCVNVMRFVHSVPSSSIVQRTVCLCTHRVWYTKAIREFCESVIVLGVLKTSVSVHDTMLKYLLTQWMDKSDKKSLWIMANEFESIKV